MLPTFPEHVARVGLRALKTVAMADGRLEDLEREMLEAINRHVFKTADEANILMLQPLPADELHHLIPDMAMARFIVNATVLMSLSDGDASIEEIAVVEAYAHATNIARDEVRELGLFATRHHRILRLDLLRRFAPPDRDVDGRGDHGAGAMWSFARELLDVPEPELHARYQALGELPDGTLGRAFIRFSEDHALPLPGRVGAAPELLVFHDATHVLTGYGTTPDEEMQIVAFHAATRGRDPVAMLLFAFMQFHLGLQVSPVAQGHRGELDPEPLFAAFKRGMKSAPEVYDWDPREDWETPVADLRERFRIPPRRLPLGAA